MLRVYQFSSTKKIFFTRLVTFARNIHSYSDDPTHVIPDHQPKCCTADEALEACLENGSFVYVQGRGATPTPLLEAMVKVAKDKDLNCIRVLHLQLEGEVSYLKDENLERFKPVALILDDRTSPIFEKGKADAIPIHAQDVPKLFTRKYWPVDIALIHVSYPDEHGFASVGMSIDITRPALKAAEKIIALANKNMPRTIGDGAIHMSHIDYLVCEDIPLPDRCPPTLTPEQTQICKTIASNLVSDGATLSLGMGAVPESIPKFLAYHRNLGMHTEMFPTSAIQLIEKGVLTNQKKPFFRGRTVTSLAWGTNELYKYIDENPIFEFLCLGYVNRSDVMSRNPRMTSIQCAMQIDLTGQVCSDSIGANIISGAGGQVDLIRGAIEGSDHKGKAILAINSINDKGESNIVPYHKLGAGIVTTRAHVQTVVTEFGYAELFGKCVRQRAFAIINLAHPAYREKLEKDAFDIIKCMPSPHD